MSTVKASNAKDLHFEHNLWINELKFSADELHFFENRLVALVTTREEKEMLAGLEQYQNQFIRQKEVLDQLQRDIHVHEQILSKRLFNNLVIDDELTNEHVVMRDRMDTYRKLFGELKTEFFRYLSKWI